MRSVLKYTGFHAAAADGIEAAGQGKGHFNDSPKAGWKRTLSDCNAILFPDYCLGCGARPDLEAWLCSVCFRRMPVPDPFELAVRLPAFEPGPDSLHAAWYTEPQSPVRALVHAAKYRYHPRLAAWMGGQAALKAPRSADIVVPVPLHALRLRERGFNQAELMARGVAALLGLPVQAPLARVSAARSQTRKSASERRIRVDAVFEATGDISGLRVLLVDDVITTGSTICAAARALLAGGAQCVHAVSAAVSRRPGAP